MTNVAYTAPCRFWLGGPKQWIRYYFVDDDAPAYPHLTRFAPMKLHRECGPTDGTGELIGEGYRLWHKGINYRGYTGDEADGSPEQHAGLAVWNAAATIEAPACAVVGDGLGIIEQVLEATTLVGAPVDLALEDASETYSVFAAAGPLDLALEDRSETYSAIAAAGPLDLAIDLPVNGPYTTASGAVELALTLGGGPAAAGLEPVELTLDVAFGVDATIPAGFEWEAEDSLEPGPGPFAVWSVGDMPHGEDSACLSPTDLMVDLTYFVWSAGDMPHGEGSVCISPYDVLLTEAPAAADFVWLAAGIEPDVGPAFEWTAGDDILTEPPAAAAFVWSAGHADQAPEPPEVVGHWPFDEGTGGNVADVIGANDAAITGAAWSAEHPTSGFSVYIDSSGKYVTIPSPLGADEYTFCFWYRRAVTGFNKGIIVEWVGAGQYIDTSTAFTNKVAYLTKEDGVVNDTNWHHLAVVHLKDTPSAGTHTVKIYLDGSEVLNTTITFPHTFGTATRWETFNSGGYVTDAWYYTRELTAEEINEIMGLI